MKVIGRPRLLEFMEIHSGAKGALQAWLREVEVASWQAIPEISQRYRHVQILSGEVILFRLCQGRYGLKVRLNFSAQVLLIVEVSNSVGSQQPLQLFLESDSVSAQLAGEAHDH